jgi:hypothetical protein
VQKCNIGWSAEGVVRQEVSWLKQDIVGRPNGFSDGSQGAANCEYGIADHIVDWGLGAERAEEDMVTIGIEGVKAFGGVLAGQTGWEKGQSKFLLQSQRASIIGHMCITVSSRK